MQGACLGLVGRLRPSAETLSSSSFVWQGCLFNIAVDMEERYDLAKEQKAKLQVCGLGVCHADASVPNVVGGCGNVSCSCFSYSQTLLAKLEVEKKTIWDHNPGMILVLDLLGRHMSAALPVCRNRFISRCVLVLTLPFLFTILPSCRIATSPSLR